MHSHTDPNPELAHSGSSGPGIPSPAIPHAAQTPSGQARQPSKVHFIPTCCLGPGPAPPGGFQGSWSLLRRPHGPPNPARLPPGVKPTLSGRAPLRSGSTGRGASQYLAAGPGTLCPCPRPRPRCCPVESQEPGSCLRLVRRPGPHSCLHHWQPRQLGVSPGGPWWGLPPWWPGLEDMACTLSEAGQGGVSMEKQLSHPVCVPGSTLGGGQCPSPWLPALGFRGPT